MSSNDTLFLGLDIGTTSVSIVVMDVYEGTNLFVKSCPHQAQMKPDCPGANIQDPNIIFQVASTIVSKALELHPGIAGIGVTGQMHGFLLTDEKGMPVSPNYTWLDCRLSLADLQGKSCLDHMQDDLGATLNNGYGFGTLYALKCGGNLPAAARRIIGVPDYIALCLTKDSQKHHPNLVSASMGHSYGFLKADRDGFEPELCRFFRDIDIPQVVPSGTIVGKTSGDIPVFVAEGDNQCSFTASVRDTDRAISANIGTSGQMSFILPKNQSSRNSEFENLDHRPFFDDQGTSTLSVAATLCGGKSFDVLTGLIRESVLAIHGDDRIKPDQLTKKLYTYIDNLPRPDSQSALIIDTRFNGSRSDEGARGAIGGIDLANMDIAHLYWGIAEGIICELADMVGRCSGILDQKESYITISGNTLQRSPALRTCLQDRMKAPLCRPQESEIAARGAAMVAASAVSGGLSHLPDIRERCIRYVAEK